MILHWDEFRSDVMFSFHELESYMAVVERQLEEAKSLAQFYVAAEHEPIVANSEEEAAERFAEYDIARSVHERMHDRVYPRILGYSLVVHLFMLVETQLSRMCDKVAERKKLDRLVRDRQGAMLKDMRKYLTKLASDAIDTAPMWEQVADLQKLRNSIVHYAGELKRSRDRDRDHIKRIIKNGVGVSGPDAEGHIRVGLMYCRTALTAVQQLFRKLFDSCGFGPEQMTIGGQ